MIPVFVERLMQVERELAKRHGPLTLFAVVLREEMAYMSSTTSGPSSNQARWDLLVAASWLEGSPSEEVSTIVKAVRRVLGGTFLLSLAQIVPLTEDSPIVTTINKVASAAGQAVNLVPHPAINKLLPDAVVVYSLIPPKRKHS